MNGLPLSDAAALAPVGLLVLGALALMLSEAFLTSGRRGYQAWLAVATAGLAAAAAVAAPPAGRLFGGMARVDAFSAFVTAVVCLGAALSALAAGPWLQARQAERGEFHALVLFAAAGMSLLASATDLLLIFICIEVMSLATYALAAWMRRGRRPAEAAFKYFLLGAFSSALFIYGAALVYGATGTTQLSGLAGSAGAIGAGGPLLAIGLGLVGAGLAFKVAAVPFHLWTPDVYEGAPTPVTAFMAAGVKTAAFAVLARVLLAVWSGAVPMPALGVVVRWLAILTMVVGNLLALPQRSVKRMLAYSSIAHAGYLLVGVVAAGAIGGAEGGVSGVLFYLAAYTATVVGAFTVVGVLERRGAPLRLRSTVAAGGSGVSDGIAPPGSDDEEPADAWDLARLAGLARRRPGLAFAMTVFMVSLAGVPPTAGFIAKVLVFKAALAAGDYLLAVLGVLTSALGAYYYLRVVVFMYMRPAEGEEAPAASPALSAALVLCAAGVLVLGVLPEPVSALARAAAALRP